MQRIFLRFLLTIIIPFQTGYSQWTWLNPLPQGNSLQDVKFISPTTAFAVGEGGTVLKTSDAGQKWISNQIGTGFKKINSVYFLTGSIGYLVGELSGAGGFLCKTLDGGETWEVLGPDFPEDLYSVWFLDELTGYVGGWYVIYRTTNGGLTWQTLNIAPDSYESICFTDSVTGYICGYWGIYKTLDGGGTWTNTHPHTYYLISLSFPSHDTGFAIGEQGILLRTVDAGATWVQQNSGTSQYMFHMDFTDNNNGIAVGDSGTIIRTMDGGNSWTLVPSNTAERLYSADFYGNSFSGISVGKFGTTLLSDDQGLNWQTVSSYVTTNELNGISFTDSQTGYCAGDLGTIIKTEDSGTTWDKLISGTVSDLYSLCFTNPQTGYACGMDGTILKTSDAGLSWTPLNSGVSGNLLSILFPSDQIGYAYAYEGDLIKTLNGGSAWDIIRDDFYIHAMYFTSPDTGYFCGTNGSIWKTTDGGTTISQLISGTSIDLYSIYFPTKTCGFVTGYISGMAGVESIILKTTDGGGTWVNKYSGTVAPVSRNSLFFNDSLHGYMLSVLSLFMTSDGGETWTLCPIDNTCYLLSNLYFTSSDTGYVVGAFGTILKTTTGGVITGIQPDRKCENMQVYPNPNTGRFVIELQEKKSQIANVQCYGIHGEKVFERKIPALEGRINIRLQESVKGLYIIRVTTSDDTWTGKVVIE